MILNSILNTISGNEGVVLFFSSFSLAMFGLYKSQSGIKKIALNTTTYVTPSQTCDGCELATDKQKKNRMLGTVKSYDRHIIICSDYHDWPKHIEKLENFPYNLIKELQILTNETIKLRITACYIPYEETARNSGSPKRNSQNVSPEHAEFIVYPDNLVFRIYEDQIKAFAELLSSPLPLLSIRQQENVINILTPEILKTENDILQESTSTRTTEKNTVNKINLLNTNSNKFKFSMNDFLYTKPKFDKLLLICTHNARDKRCGQNGQLIAQEIRTYLSKNSISESKLAVRNSSHIGGHEFAAVAIAYPMGVWYGQITTDAIPDLVHSILNETIYNPCLRGANKSHLLNW
eukprot:gene16496-22517_t